MPINFIPNDPRAGAAAPGIMSKAKRPSRPASKSGFVLSGVAPVGLFPPGSAQFLFWQCREAALAAVEAWESYAGTHKTWQGNRKKLPLLQDTGVDLNAFYDRESFSFFHMAVGSTTFFSGASTDVVAHEVGHGLLDSVRPDLWDVNFLEAGAFHEAFGDCVAMLTALGDIEQRKSLLAITSDLRKRNFVESSSEDLSEGVRRIMPQHNAAEPRHAFNKFKFQIPDTLPDDGGPGKLINEVHSFGMVMTGCFWDLIANLFEAAPSKNEASLLEASRLAGQLLVAGAKAATIAPRFLQSVGRAMVLADQSLHSGANHEPIRKAFQAHDILLGSNTMLAPAVALAGEAPRGASLAAATRKDLARHLGAPPGTRLTVEAKNVFGTRIIDVIHKRDVSLGVLDKSLKGVVAEAHEPTMIGSSGGRAAVLGSLPQAVDAEGEVRSFVRSLLEHDRIDFGTQKKKSAIGKGNDKLHATHSVVTERGKKMLRRIRFRCQSCTK